MTLDRLFRLALLALLSTLLLLGWTLRENGRYVYHPKTENAREGMLIDSRTGIMFLINLDTTGACGELHPQTGELVIRKIWPRESVPVKK